MKKLLFSIVALIVLLVAAALIGPSFVDWNKYKPEIVAKVREATGRDLSIGGNISLSVLPSPTLSVEDVSLANIPGAAEPRMASLKALDVRVAFGPLLSGTIKVESVALIDPMISLEVLKDGRRNWEIAPAGAPPPPAAPAKPEEAGAPEAGAAIQLESVRIKNGTLVYRDARTGTSERIEKLNADLSAESLAGPATAEGSLVARGIPLSFDASAGRIDTGKAIPVHLALALTDAGAKANFNGALSAATAEGQLTGKLEAQGSNLARLVGALGAAGGGGAAAPALPAPLSRDFTLTGQLTASAKSVALNDINLGLGNTTVTGAASVVPGTPMQVDIALQANQIDLDEWLKALEKSDSKKADPPETKDGKAGGGGGAAAAAKPAAAFALPAGIKGTLDVGVGAVAYRGDAIHQVRLRAALEGGRLAVKQLSALLPGGSDVAASGTLSSTDKGPAFDGTIEAASDNLRGVLDWLGIDSSAVPPDRLHKFSLTGKVKGGPAQVDVTGIDLRLDTTRIVGGVAVAVRARPAFGARLDVDRLNLDAYLPAPATGPAGAAKPAAQPAKAPAQAGGGGLAFLKTFDANIQAKVGNLTFKDVEIEGVALDATLQNGTLTVRDASVANLAGGQAKVAGTVAGLGNKPSVDGSFDVRTKDPVRLLRLAGITPPDAAARLGPVALQGKAKGALESFAIDAALDAGGGRVGVKGTGGLTDKGPVYDVAIDARHDSLVDLVRVFDPGYRPAGQNLGGFALAAALRGDSTNAELSGIKGKVGPVNVAGDVKARLDGPRPSLGVTMQTSEIIADLFLPPKAGAGKEAGGGGGGGGAAQAAPVPGEHWSREPFDTSALKLVDADVKLSAPALSYDKYRVDKPEVALVLKDGVLDVQKLTGTMFEGGFDMKGQLAASDPPKLAGSVKVANANIRQALFQAGNIDVADGRLDFSMDVAGAGASQYALVSSLSGKGAVNVTNGLARGFNLKAVSDQLKSLSSVIDYLKLLQASMSGGETRFSKLDGTFTIDKGVVRTDNVEMLADAGKGKAVGTIDLPRWQMDMKAEFALTEHPSAPPFGMTVSGPPDAPQRKFDTARLEAYLVQKGVGGLLKKVLPQKEGAPAAPGAQPAPAEKPLDTLLKKMLPGATQEPAAQPPAAQPAPQQPATQPAPQPVPNQSQGQPAPANPLKTIEQLLKGK